MHQLYFSCRCENVSGAVSSSCVETDEATYRQAGLRAARTVRTSETIRIWRSEEEKKEEESAWERKWENRINVSRKKQWMEAIAWHCENAGIFHCLLATLHETWVISQVKIIMRL
jgi:hypothetical protein